MMFSFAFGMKAEMKTWQKDFTFADYLDFCDISREMLDSISPKDQEYLSDIQSKYKYYELLDDNGTLMQALIDLASHKEQILHWCEKQELNLKAKQKKNLSDQAFWKKHLMLVSTAEMLMEKVGSEVWSDFNLFKAEVEKVLKAEKIKLSAPEKNSILAAVSWYDEHAKKVIKKIHKLKGDKLEQLLEHLGCEERELADFGFYATEKNGEYIEYESETDLRDSENIPLEESIHDYFLREVKPYVEEAWINLDSVKIGYEINCKQSD